MRRDVIPPYPYHEPARHYACGQHMIAAPADSRDSETTSTGRRCSWYDRRAHPHRLPPFKRSRAESLTRMHTHALAAVLPPGAHACQWHMPCHCGRVKCAARNLKCGLRVSQLTQLSTNATMNADGATASLAVAQSHIQRAMARAIVGPTVAVPSPTCYRHSQCAVHGKTPCLRPTREGIRV